MSVIANRLKYGHTLIHLCLNKFVDVFFSLKYGHEIKTLQGILERTPGLKQADKPENPPKHFVEKLKSSASEATRNNIGYLKQAIGKPITATLKGLQGI